MIGLFSCQANLQFSSDAALQRSIQCMDTKGSYGKERLSQDTKAKPKRRMYRDFSLSGSREEKILYNSNTTSTVG